jgi:hypothetical protein
VRSSAGINPFTLMAAHVEQPPRRPSEVDAALPPELDEILLRALEKDPEDLQSAELFRRSLETLEHELEPGCYWANIRSALKPSRMLSPGADRGANMSKPCFRVREKSVRASNHSQATSSAREKP